MGFSIATPTYCKNNVSWNPESLSVEVLKTVTERDSRSRAVDIEYRSDLAEDSAKEL
jgi:hypothetical protein